MKTYFLSICLLLLGSFAPSICMLMLQGEPATIFLDILENRISPNDVDDNLMTTIGIWLSENFNIAQYNALPTLAAKRQFLYAFFPSREKYFKIGEQKYCICMGANAIPNAYSISEIGTYNRLPNLPDSPQAITSSGQPTNNAIGLFNTLSGTFERISNTVSPIIQSPYFKATCAAAISGIVTYYAIGWSNKNKAERRKRSQKKWALCSAVVVGIGSFNYFDNY